MEHLTARHQQLQARTGGQQFHEQWRCRHDLLKVVQHEQPVLLTQRPLQQFQWRSGAALQAEGLHHGGKDQFGIVNGSERDEAGFIGEATLRLGRDVERQARLAHASGAGEGEQAHFRTHEQGTSGSNLPLPPDERREWQREGRGISGRAIGGFPAVTRGLRLFLQSIILYYRNRGVVVPHTYHQMLPTQ